jgi:hypothetical protein
MLKLLFLFQDTTLLVIVMLYFSSFFVIIIPTSDIVENVTFSYTRGYMLLGPFPQHADKENGLQNGATF